MNLNEENDKKPKIIKLGKFKDANQKKIIPVSSIQTGSVNGHDKDVSIQVHKEGDEVKSIDVVCSCGKKIEIICQYE